MAGGFRVPYAFDETGRLVARADATKNHRYRCPNPACVAGLSLHDGPSGKRRKHFHHSPAANCDADLVTHALAILRIVSAVSAWKAGGATPLVVRTCATDGCEEVWQEPISANITQARRSTPLPNGRCADVDLYSGADRELLIEVWYTHAVPDDKVADLVGFEWIEVQADRVIETPLKWLVIRSSGRPWRCAGCVEKQRQAARKAAEIRRWDRQRTAQEKARRAEAERIEEERERTEREAALALQRKRDSLLAKAADVAANLPAYTPRVIACRRCAQDLVAWSLTKPGSEAPRPWPVPFRCYSPPGARHGPTGWYRPTIWLQVCPGCDVELPVFETRTPLPGDPLNHLRRSARASRRTRAR